MKLTAVTRTSLRAGAAMAAALVMTAAGSIPATAHDDDTGSAHHDPPIGGVDPVSVWLPSEVSLYREGKVAYLSAMPYLVAGSQDIRVETKRPSFWKEPVTTWTVGSRSGTFKASAKSMNSLPALFKVEVLKGSTVYSTKWVSGCLGNYGSRIAPDGPATNPYPMGCNAYHPFARGSVQGLPARWAVSPIEDSRLKVPAKGKLRLRVTLTRRYANPWQVPAAARTATAVLTSDSSEAPERRMSLPGSRTAPTPAPQVDPDPAARPSVAASGSTGPRPDLRSLPAFDISVNRKGTLLRFAATVWNAGDSPLVVDGYREGVAGQMTAYQYFFNSAGEQVGHQKTGIFKFHGANHQHWHYQDFARYRLLKLDKTPVATSGKISFCLANTDAIDYTVPGADMNPGNTDLSSACGDNTSISLREVLASGSGDTYAQFRAGQAISLKNVKPGTYYVSVEANPMGRIIEQSTTNNVALRRIKIIKDRTTGLKKVKVSKVGIINDTGWGGLQ